MIDFYTSILHFMRYSCKEDGIIVNRPETTQNESEEADEGRMDGNDERGVPSCAQTPKKYEMQVVEIIMGDNGLE